MKKIITIFGGFVLILGLIGVVLWNAPGVKSRRLSRQCNQKLKSAIETAESDKQRLIFETSRDLCYTNIAREYQNTQLCDLIKDESVRKLCFVHVFYWDKSIGFCENDDQKDICLHVVSIKNNDKSICSKIDNDSIRKLCTQEN